MAFSLLHRRHRGKNMKKNQKKTYALLTTALIAIVGSYNALMIHSDSNLSLSDSANIKRIDEVYGIVKVGRNLAVATDWRKIPAIENKVAILEAQTMNKETEPAAQENPAAVEASLNMGLVEVMNPKKWLNGVKASEFSGSIATNNGMIESLKASLPDGLNVDIAFSEMTGNTFEYDLNGEVFSGLMYQVDQNSYMVTLTNGPLEGTRLRFEGQDAQISSENFLAENHNIEIGDFGSETAPEISVQNEDQTTETAQTFDFSTTQSI
jgi:hypothetical protein